MDNNLHINERLGKQRIAELLAQRKTAAPDDKEAQTKLINEIMGELVMYTSLIAPVTITEGEDGERAVSFQMIKVPQGDQFFPVFTSSEDLDKWTEVSESDTIQLPFDEFAKMLSNDATNACGIAINPFTDNLIVNKRLVAQWYESKQMVTQGYATNRITENTKYSVFDPEPYPTEIADKLCETAKGLSGVERVWLRGTDLNGKDGYLAVIEVTGDKNAQFMAFGEAVKDMLKDKLIHFMPYEADVAKEAVENTEPIYTKGK